MQRISWAVACLYQWHRPHPSAQHHAKVTGIEAHYEAEKKRTRDENNPEGHTQSTRDLL